jgi:hypothetical protein
LLSDNPAESVAAGITSGGKVGTSTIDGVRCNHFLFDQTADDLELELWLEDNQQALPRRFVVTYRSLPGRRIFIAELSGCDVRGTPHPTNTPITRSPIIKLLVDCHTRRIRPTAQTRIEPIVP